MRTNVLNQCLTLVLVCGTQAADLSQINDWLYVLDASDVSIDQIASSGFDLVVMDYSKDGSVEQEYTQADIDRLHQAGMVAVAYMSIGEAEDYRFYWQDEWATNPPSWLGPVNPDWEGNFKVRFWEPEWQTIIVNSQPGGEPSFLDRITSAGFDGVYPDIVDAYEYWSEEQTELTRLEARVAMKQFVEAIRIYARETRGSTGFLIFPQNAPRIILDDDDQLDDLGRSYLDLCDGIGAEDTWFNETQPQPGEDISEIVPLLRHFRSTGRERLVICVDYVWDDGDTEGNRDRYNSLSSQARAEGFIPYAAHSDRDLNKLLIREPTDGYLTGQPFAEDTAVEAWPVQTKAGDR